MRPLRPVESAEILPDQLRRAKVEPKVRLRQDCAVNSRGLFKALAVALIGLAIFIVILWLWVGENAS
jgi:hypothetical protein